MRSSYIQNNFGDVLYAIITAFRPINAVELGILDGYSTIHIAKGLKKNEDVGVQAKLDAYDLFEDYLFKHGNKDEVEAILRDESVADYVDVHKVDAFEVHSKYADNSVYFLHVDLSNTGEIVRKILEHWHSKMVIGGIILFEGGSEERDKIDWMVKYNKEPIKPEIENNLIVKHNYIYGTYQSFPSLTMLLKKWPHEQGYS